MIALALLLLLAPPGDPGAAAYRQGAALFEQHRTAEAIPLLERAANADPKNAQYWKALGAAQASLGQIRDAVNPFRQACTLNPALLDACYYYGRALYANDRYADALAPLEAALKVDAVRGRAATAIAQCNEALGRAEEAEKWFRSAVSRRDAANRDARLAYGRFLVRQARAAEAVAILEQAQQPETADARYELGLALFQSDRSREAADSLERAVRLDPAHAAAHNLLAKVYRRLGRPSDAEREERAAAASAVQ